MTLSDRTRHFFHVVSNIRPIVWIGLYVALMPLFALIYWWLPDTQFRVPDGAGTDFGSWLYYSIVTITTLGFGDYTPAHGWAQAVTAIEVMCGLVTLGFFLNAVGSMKSEIDVASEAEKQRRINDAEQKRQLRANAPLIIHTLDSFLSFCYAVTTPSEKRNDDNDASAVKDTTNNTPSDNYGVFNHEFTIDDMKDMFSPSRLPLDYTDRPAVERLIRSAQRSSLALDSLQQRIDLTQWPKLLENCFSFVANCQLFSSADAFEHTDPKALPKHEAISELHDFIHENGIIAEKIRDDLRDIERG